MEHSGKTENVQDPSDDNIYHLPIMLEEAVNALAIKPDGCYVDCTFGGGGHSNAILKKLSDKGQLIVFDQDIDAKRNLPPDKRITFIQQNFRHLNRFLRLNKFLEVDGILADLGVSSHQFDEGDRGFSIRFDAPLDMRMDRRQQLTAAEILRKYSEVQLHKMFEKYGEVTNAKTLAATIVAQRNHSSLNTISQFREAIKSVVKGNPNKYLAQVFQALRIEVNDEIGALRELLEQSVPVLKKDGRLVMITFHSLEDREVKNFFRYGKFEEPEAHDLFGTRPQRTLSIINKKPLTASENELKQNPRSRSAKLRVAEKK